MTAQPVKILIGALGGEGGGVLSGWLVDAAMRADLPVQGTSVPGVAQRTGATTYYVEIYPETNGALAGRRPLLALYPGPADVDIVVASELLEAARAAENGFVSPERTTLIAATHRIFATVEKMAMTDGRADAPRILRALRELAKRPLLFDLTRSRAKRSLPLNAVLLGAIAGTGQLPIPRAAYEEAIRASGIAVEANLKGFAAGFELAIEGPSPDIAPRAEPGPARLPQVSLDSLIGEAARALPPESLANAEAGIARVADYQDAAYARLYLDRVERIAALPAAMGKLVAETARHLALWMSYEDVIRVAQLKSRGTRLGRVQDELQARANEPFRVTEFFKPGIDEVSALLPPRLGRALRGWGERRNLLHRLHLPMHIKTTTISGFLRLWLLARLRRWRPHSLRWAEEQALIERWLDAVAAATSIGSDFALEVVILAKVLKGYSDTQRRGRVNFLTIFERLVLPAIAERRNAAFAVREAREAALADPEGGSLNDAMATLTTQAPLAAE